MPGNNMPVNPRRMGYPRGQGIKTHVFLNFWRQNVVKFTILGVLSARKSCYYYCEYVCNFTRKSNEKLGPQNNVVTLAVRNCSGNDDRGFEVGSYTSFYMRSRQVLEARSAESVCPLTYIV